MSKGIVFVDLPPSPTGQPDVRNIGLAAGVGRLLSGLAIAQHDMPDAAEALQSKLGDRGATRAVFDARQQKFVNRR